MKFLETIGYALPPWRARVKAAVVAASSLGALVWIVKSHQAHQFWQTLVDRRDVIAGPLLSVNASLLGFSITTFSVLLSVRKDEKFAKIQDFERANDQMWGALIAASWATGACALNSLLVIVLKGPAFADWFQNLITASLFAMMMYVALTFVGVIAVIQALVWILRPVRSHSKDALAAPDNASFNMLGPPPRD
jgi:hypothetical protein